MKAIWSNRMQRPSIRLPLVVLVSITCVYLFFAPNYEWNLEETGTAYGADFLQEWVGARMVLTGHVSELYDVDVFRAWQYDPKGLALRGRRTNISHPCIHLRIMFFLSHLRAYLIVGRWSFGCWY